MMNKKLLVPDSYVGKKNKTKDNVGFESAWVKSDERFLDPSKIKLSLKQRLPNPTGWRMLVVPYQGKQKTDGGIHIPDQIREKEALATSTGYVLKTGPGCYQDKNKFPEGPYCKEGDWVLIARYAGTRVKMDDFEVRILNDDEILGTVESPEDILGVYA